MRRRLYEIIEGGRGDDRLSAGYDIFMMTVIFVSIIPLGFKTMNSVFLTIDRVTAAIFIIDYLLRAITADFKLKRGAASFVVYPFTPMAVIDLIAVLPSLTMLNSGLRLVKIVRMMKTLRVFRLFKAVRYSKNINTILCVFRKQKDSLLVVLGIAILYILISALVILNVEPETFDSFFDAVYWATVSLTTVGYGDIYPVTVIGKIVTMISSFMGIAIVALPAGILTSGLMEELNQSKK